MEIEKMLTKLLNGEDIKQIVKERLDYLRSDEYQNSMCHVIATKGTYIIPETIKVVCPAKWQGFIPETIYIHPDNDLNTFTSETNIYEEYLLYLKELIETRTISFEKAIKAKPAIFVRKYFIEDCSSEYKELVDGMRNANFGDVTIREEMRLIIPSYKACKDKFASFKDFYSYYIEMEELHNSGKTSKTDPRLKEYFQIKEGKCSIGDLKGLGIPPAMCSEIAVCLQNLFSFLGFDTYMLISKVDSEGHHFNVINENGVWKIMDVARAKFGELPKDFDIDAFINGDYKFSYSGSTYTSINDVLTNIDISKENKRKK